MSFSLLELNFTVLRSIKSLPPFHGARWGALFRYVCRTADIVMDDIILGIMPWRYGIHPMQRGDSVGVRVLLSTQHSAQVPRLLDALRRESAAEGEFVVGKSLALHHAACGLSGKDATTYTPTPLHTEHIFAHAYALSQCRTWSLRFHAPLRLVRPAGQRRESGHYCTPSFFASNPMTLQQIIAKVRFLPWPAPATPEIPYDAWPVPVRHSLQWEDMRYNKERGIALGGVTGELCFDTAPPFDVAQALAFGQFSGVGKNPRFGLGYYVICL